MDRSHLDAVTPESGLRGRWRSMLRPAVLAAALASCGTPFPYADSSKPHHGPDGFRNLGTDTEPGGGVPWYEAMWRNLRGDFRPSRPPQGGYDEFQRRWLQPLDAATLQAAAQSPTPQVAWLGHASVWLQAGGRRVLIDPQLSKLAGPYSWLSARRRVDAPIAAADLAPVDLLLITHNHFDHLDVATLAPLFARSPQPQVLVPLGLKKFMESLGARNVEELDWWDERQAGPLHVRLLPAQHWSRRTLTDTNQSLWGGWEVVWRRPEGEPWRFVHVGDTGYNESLYRSIGERIGGPVDLLAVPIGAYEPRDFMRRQHANPDEAVLISQLLNARQAFGIHWGTFELTNEPFDQPPLDLARALKAHGQRDDFIWLLKQGEVRAAGQAPGTVEQGRQSSRVNRR